ncbi:MAG: hypothetical protein KJ630_03610 [Proteobacteria bacterium]|nr:hypothetical protein [Pseudomonadota bacterium]
MLLTQRKSWSLKAYGQDEISFARTKEQAIEFYKSNKLIYIPPNLDDIKIIKGESVMMVYSGVNKTEYSTFKTLGDFVANSTNKMPAPALVFAYIDGKWCVWE